ncbi:MAG: MATE family efflux transporter [Ruminococcus sp.]|nr:MATE family efflux transporter [Ruminococcus sp.]
MTKSKIQLSDHFSYKKLISFTLSPIAMMIFTSIYGVVDGYFVSNYAGKTPFAALNLIWPLIMVMGSIGFMFGTGGSALVAKTMGEGDKKKANSQFSLLVYISLILSVFIALIAFVLMRPISVLLGAQGELLSNCMVYGRILCFSVPFFVLQFEFQSFFVTAEKPNLGLYMTLLCGITNMILDWLFVAVFNYGLAGAATATALSQLIGGIFPLIYFSKKNGSLLKLCKTKFNSWVLSRTCTNGMSELLSNISMSLVSMLYNAQLMKFTGEDGVAAYGVLMYVNLIFLSIFIGYSIGTAPIISYNYGAGNQDELKSLFKKSLVIIVLSSVVMLFMSLILANPLSKLFVGYDENLLNLTQRGFFIFSFSFLFAGIPMFASAFFTALNNGIVSAIISVLRTVVFQVAFVLLLPIVLEVDGIWCSIVFAELCSLIVAAIMFVVNKNKYHYYGKEI